MIRFLEAGSKVKVTIMFRGREQSRPELGYRLLQRLGADVADYGFVKTSAKQDGRNMTMVLAPHRGAKTRARRHMTPTPGGATRPARASPPPEAPTPAELRNHAQGEDPQRRFQAIPPTGTGKIVRQKAGRSHLLEHKASKRTRRLDGRTEVAANDNKRVKKLLNG